MSLLNEALKKAQRQQHTEQQASARVIVQSSFAGTAPAVTRTGMSTRLFTLLIAGAVVLVSGSVLGTVLLLRKPDAAKAAPAPLALTAPTPAAPTAAAPQPAAIVTQATSAPAADTSSLAIRVALPAAPVTQQAEATPASVPEPAAAVTTTPVPAAAPAPAAVTTPQIRIASIDEDTAAARETAAYSVINAMRISGIRGTGTDSRVLIDGRVYRINSVVDRTLGLRLTAVEADRLLFTDSRGTVFTRML
ncbi:MAG: hypothetical protein KBG39_03015 [Opitutaceae bacterium]|jgi:hypothetical protein|nr:hypothetical protein [Opitutaceae bacterium]MBP8961893.1 hypothetical protein [Opitutaceae bacterium]HOG92623.1 hypothetical protein [Opitutaceae bacterium]